MLSSICTTSKNYVLFFVLNSVIRNLIVVVFWYLNLSILFEKFIVVSLLLSADCFRDLFEISIMSYLRAIDGLVSFFS